MAIPNKRTNDTNETLVEVKKLLMSIPAGAELQRKIAEAAFYKSETRGFESGFEDQDWIEAEREILSSLQLQEDD